MLRRFRFPVSSMVVVSLGSSATAPLRFLGSQSNGNGNGSSGGGSGSSQTSSVSYGELRQALTVFGFQSSSGSVQVTVADVKKRYIELAKQYHPDVISVRAHASPSTSTEVMIKINEAHETLIRAGKCGMLHSGGAAAAVPGQRGTSHAAADAKRPSNSKNGSSSQSSTRKPSADYSSKMRRPAEDRYQQQQQHSSNTKSANANKQTTSDPNGRGSQSCDDDQYGADDPSRQYSYTAREHFSEEEIQARRERRHARRHTGGFWSAFNPFSTFRSSSASARGAGENSQRSSEHAEDEGGPSEGDVRQDRQHNTSNRTNQEDHKEAGGGFASPSNASSSTSSSSSSHGNSPFTVRTESSRRSLRFLYNEATPALRNPFIETKEDEAPNFDGYYYERTYAKIVAGTTVTTRFDIQTKTFVLVFRGDPFMENTVTRIILHEELHYRDGFDVTIEVLQPQQEADSSSSSTSAPGSGIEALATWSHPATNVIDVKHDRSRVSLSRMQVTVWIRPRGITTKC